MKEILANELPQLFSKGPSWDEYRRLQQWLSRVCNLCVDDLLGPADIQLWNLEQIYRQLKEKRIGYWCGGVAATFMRICELLGVPAFVYSYRYDTGQWNWVSHETNLVRHQGKWYFLDAYLNYYYTDEAGKLLPALEVLSLIKEKKYDQIKVVQEEVDRDFLTLPGHPRNDYYRVWCFPNEDTLPVHEVRNGVWVCYHAKPTPEGLYRTKDWSEMFAKLSQGRSLSQWLLDLMIMNPLLYVPRKFQRDGELLFKELLEILPNAHIKIV